jgi:hypothetical protein
MWAFTQNCFAEAAILHWCRVFGSKNEPTHFTQFFEGKSFLGSEESLVTLEFVRERLFRAAGMSESDYLGFWENIKQARDKYFVHTEFTSTQPSEFPDLNVLKRTGLEMRDIICEVVSNAQSKDFEMLKHFEDLVQWNTNRKYIGDLEADSLKIKKLIE